jgi:recombination protein RecT
MGRDLEQRVTQNAVAASAAPQSIGQLIQSLRPELARALPKHMDADRMARIALTVLRKTPKLAECSPESFMGALLTSAQLGLEPGAGDEAYLVPYGRECQFIVGYQGYAKLFWQHPMAKHLDAQAVYELDEFDYAYGLDPFLRHKPALGDRGAVIAYYAVAKLSTGASAFVVLSPEDVRALRGGKVGPDSRFKGGDPMRWMERKTAVRQLVKLLPKSVELQRALAADETVRTDLREDAIDDLQMIELPSMATDTPGQGTQDGPADPSGARGTTEPATAPQQTKGGITQAQQRALHAVLRKAVGDDRNAGLVLIAQELELETLGSTDELTKAQGSTAIDKLQALVDAQHQGPSQSQADVDKAWGIPPEGGDRS